MRNSVGARSAFRWFIRTCCFVLAMIGVPLTSSADPARETSTYELPSDQPHGGVRPLELPPPPPTFNVVDHGWIHFAYPPSTRGRVQPLMRAADEIRAELGRRL